MEQTVRKIGNSFGIIIPNSIIKKLNLNFGKKVYLEVYEEEKTLVVRLKNNLASGITPQFLKYLKDFTERHKDVLQELARR